MEVYRAELVRRGGLPAERPASLRPLAGGAAYFNIWTAVEGEGGFGERMVLATIPRDVATSEYVDDWDTMGMRTRRAAA
jgi:hypothetical protein